MELSKRVGMMTCLIVYWWRHKAITWTNVDLSCVRSCDNHLRAISLGIHQAQITEFRIIDHYQKCHSNLLGQWGKSSWPDLIYYSDVILSMMATEITGVLIVCSTVYSGTNQRKHQSFNQRKHQSSASLAFVMGIHQWPMDYPQKGPIMWQMFPFDDVSMMWIIHLLETLNKISFRS